MPKNLASSVTKALVPPPSRTIGNQPNALNRSCDTAPVAPPSIAAVPFPTLLRLSTTQAVAAELTPGGLSRRRLGPADRARPTVVFWCPRESRRVRTRRGQLPRQSSSTAARYGESLYGGGQKANSRSLPRRAAVRAPTVQAIQRRSCPDPVVTVLTRMSECSLSCPKFTVRRSSPAAGSVW